MTNVAVIGSVYRGAGREGDFAWMIEQPRYARTLFVFNDNETQWRAHRRDPADPAGCSPGGGNAVIRPFQSVEPPRAVGIPTGDAGGGYHALTPEVRAVLDQAIDTVRALLATGRYDELVYSASSHDPDDLGTGIFRVAPEVRAYIVTGLRSIGGQAPGTR